MTEAMSSIVGEMMLTRELIFEVLMNGIGRLYTIRNAFRGVNYRDRGLYMFDLLVISGRQRQHIGLSLVNMAALWVVW
jgi:hypothetical protein